MPMAMHSALFNFAPQAGADPQVVSDNTPVSTRWIDCQDAKSVSFFVVTGTVADADVTVAVTLQHADAVDQSDAEPVPAGAQIGDLPALTATSDGVVKGVAYDPWRRYVRATATPSNNTGSLPTGM